MGTGKWNWKEVKERVSEVRKVGGGEGKGGQVAKGGEGEKGRQREWGERQSEWGSQVAERGEGVHLCQVNHQVNRCVHIFQ